MSSNSIEQKMSKLVERVNDYRADASEEIVAMQKTLKNAMLKKNLKEHPALMQLLSTLRKRENAYSLILQNKRDLSDVERRGYFDRREEVRFIISFFDVDKTLETLENALDYQLSGGVDGLSTPDEQ